MENMGRYSFLMHGNRRTGWTDEFFDTLGIGSEKPRRERMTPVKADKNGRKSRARNDTGTDDTGR